MGEYVAVEINSLSHEIADANRVLQNRIDAARGCVSALQGYCSEAQLRGAAYANSKMYYLSTYSPLLNQIISACNEIVSLNNTIVPTFLELVPDTQGYKADTQIIEDKIKELRDDNIAYQTKIAEYRYWMGTPFAPDYSSIISWYENQIDTNNNVIIPPLEAIVEGLRAFNSACAGVYDEVASKIQRLASAIRMLGSDFSWNNLGNRYIIPTGVVNEIKMMELELLSQLGESDEKDIEIINTLFPDWSRDLAEAINSSSVGASQTVEKNLVIPFPDGSSITYKVSAKVSSSSVSIADVNLNLIKQSIALNCNGFTFTEEGFSIPATSVGTEESKVKTDIVSEIDPLTGRLLLGTKVSTAVKKDNYSLTSSIVAKKSTNYNQPSPKVRLAVKPDPAPWLNKGWNWACEKTESVKEIANNVGDTVGESLRNVGSPECVCTVAAVGAAVLVYAVCLMPAL